MTDCPLLNLTIGRRFPTFPGAIPIAPEIRLPLKRVGFLGPEAVHVTSEGGFLLLIGVDA